MDTHDSHMSFAKPANISIEDMNAILRREIYKSVK